ncbi:MAG: hypothetical protein Q4F54_06665 [Coriobacteriia bacterium]|nr:hypothetical protein [Coriobacteriia bacterium]
MLKENVKKIVVALSCTLVCFFMLAGCSGFGFPASQADAEKAVTSAYFAEVNTLVGEFKTTLGDFPADVKEKKVDSMKEKVDAAQKLIDQFSKLDVPKNCEDVHKLYTDGLVQMQQALSNYVQVYSDFVSGSIDNNVLNQRVADVQTSYNQGIDLLAQADKLAAQK